MRQRDPRRFFSTAQFSRLVIVRGQLVRQPTSPMHAKEMGTRTTVCGLSCDNWYRFWDRPFDKLVDERCRDCLMKMAELLKERAEP
jgi:hypothetical protein